MTIIIAIAIFILFFMFVGLCGSSRRTSNATRSIDRKLADFHDALTPEARERMKEARTRRLWSGSTERWEALKAKRDW
jgi:hypothetical protein